MKIKDNKNNKKDLVAAAIIGAVVLIICSVLLFARRKNLSENGDMAAVVNIKSDVYGVFLLKDYSDNTEFIYSMENDGLSVHFVIKNGGISFFNVDCPDKLCEKSGVLSKENDTAVCMPNKVSVRIMPESELDKDMRSKIISQ